MSKEKCPRCGRDDMRHGEIDVIDKTTYRERQCFDCGWYEGIEADLSHFPKWDNVPLLPLEELAKIVVERVEGKP